MSTMTFLWARGKGGCIMLRKTGQILKNANAGDPVALARALVATPSVNPELEADGSGEAAIAEDRPGHCWNSSSGSYALNNTICWSTGSQTCVLLWSGCWRGLVQ